MNAKLRLAQDGPIEVCYSPFEYVNTQARVVIVGITPGRTQMLNALTECRRQLDSGADSTSALIAAKLTGGFSGSIRPNLVALLDRVGINRWLNIRSCDGLFGLDRQYLQTASVLRHPVFLNGGNYNGTPNMIRHPILREQLISNFGQDARALSRAVFLPLGDKVSAALHSLADQGYIDKQRILDGMPHPSGANAERIAYFLGNKARSALSSKTNPDKLDTAREGLVERVMALSKAASSRIS